MKYRKKPVEIEAMQFLGDSNLMECLNFIGIGAGGNDSTIIIATLEGDMKAKKGDWIIRGVNGEFYPCKPDIFEKTYEKPCKMHNEDGSWKRPKEPPKKCGIHPEGCPSTLPSGQLYFHPIKADLN